MADSTALLFCSIAPSTERSASVLCGGMGAKEDAGASMWVSPFTYKKGKRLKAGSALYGVLHVQGHASSE